MNRAGFATELTIAWLGNPNNRASAEDVAAYLRNIHAAMSELASGTPSVPNEAQAVEDHVPAVSVRKSLASNEHIISMIDGKPYRTLRRHLTTHGLTPDEYRARYKLKPDYPMTAPGYSEVRRAMAKKIGLGSQGRKAKPAAQAAAPAPKRKPRTSKSN